MLRVETSIYYYKGLKELFSFLKDIIKYVTLSLTLRNVNCIIELKFKWLPESMSFLTMEYKLGYPLLVSYSKLRLYIWFVI